MKKYIVLLLVGFLIFGFGLAISVIELNKFEVLSRMPKNFKVVTDKITIELDDNKEYELRRADYNENINIEKVIDNSMEDEILIEIEHLETSVTLNTIKTTDDEVEIVFSNKFVFDSEDIIDILKLGLRSLKEKRIYNYKLLKYSNIKVYGSEKNLENIEI